MQQNLPKRRVHMLMKTGYKNNGSYFISGSELLENAKEQYIDFLNSDKDEASGGDFDFDDFTDEIADYPDTDEEPESEIAEDTQTTKAEPATEKNEAPNPRTGHYPVTIALAVISAAAICAVCTNKRR